MQSVSRHCISSVKSEIVVFFGLCQCTTISSVEAEIVFFISFNVVVPELLGRHFQRSPFLLSRQKSFFCHFQCTCSVTFWSPFLLSRQKALCFSLALICQFLNFWVAIFNVSFLLSKQRLLGSLYLFLENSTSGDSRRNSFPISFMIAMRHLCGILAGKLFSFNFSA